MPESIVFGPPLEEEQGVGATTLAGFIQEVTQRYAANEALAYQDDSGQISRWSYQQLSEQSMQVARALLAGGLVKGTRVGILMDNRLEWVSAFFGVTLAGGVAVPLSTFATPRELDYFIRQSDMGVLLMAARVARQDFIQDLLGLCPELSEGAAGNLQLTTFPSLRRVVAIGKDADDSGIEAWDDFLLQAEHVTPEFAQAVAATVCPADEAVVFFSSGSTALPKGIIHNHHAAALQCWRWARLLELEPGVRSWTPNGFFWSGNFAVLLASTLAVGGCVVLQGFFKPEKALKLMESERISYPFVWPHQMASLEEDPTFLQVDLSAIRYVDPSWCFAQHPTVSHTGWRYPSNSFGCSETFTINCSYPSSTPDDVRGDSHGIPMPGNTLRIIDPLTGAPMPLGERGEICIKGPTLMRGYLRTPLGESLDSEGFYRTGDGGCIDEQGRLCWEGRLSDVIKTGGANVSPVEVDTVIKEYPGIKAAHTVGVPHDTLGELVVACIVAMEGQQILEDALHEFLKERLANYKLPKHILFFDEEELSFTANAKIRVDALRELAAQRIAPG